MGHRTYHLIPSETMKRQLGSTLLFVFLVAATSCHPVAGAKGENRPMDRAEAEATRANIIQKWYSSQRDALAETDSTCQVRSEELSMPYSFKVFGEEPEGGHSLWISLHGGGSCPTAVNDSQWENQKRLYRPSEGIYLAPRAPWDDWDMWFKAPIDPMFETLIRTMVVCHGVNPNRIYLLGYSAGGDGVWRLAPRLADHWASASMMAGHPGDISLVNVRNMPFTIWVGAEDAAYNRNEEVRLRGEILDSLQADDPKGYIHDCHVIEGKGHWMDLEDSAALPWMAAYTRNPRPTHIVWRQEGVARSAFYWLEVPKEEASQGQTVEVNIAGNEIRLLQCDYSHITLLLDDDLVDLDRPVRVLSGNTILADTLLPRTAATLKATLDRRGDPYYAFPAQIEVSLE